MFKTLFSRRRRAYTFVANKPVKSFRGMTMHQIDDAVQAHTGFAHALIVHLGYKPRRLVGLTRPGALSTSFMLRLANDGEAATFIEAANAIMGGSSVVTLFEPDKSAMTIDALFADMSRSQTRAITDDPSTDSSITHPADTTSPADARVASFS